MKCCALIVDDEPIILKGLLGMSVWTSMDVHPVPAMTGLQALELMKQYEFDMIITDIQMPEMDGLELIAKVRLQKPEIPIVVLSGYDSFAYAKEAIRYKVVDYLLKPISQVELSDIITRIICEAEERKERRMQEEILRKRAGFPGYHAAAGQFEQYLLGKKMSEGLQAILGTSFILAECILKAEDEKEKMYYLSCLFEKVKELICWQKSETVITMFMGHVVFAVNSAGADFCQILEKLEAWGKELDWAFSVSYIEVEGQRKEPNLYQRLSNVSEYRFYYEGFCVVTENMMEEGEGEPEFSLLEQAVRSERTKEAYQELEKVLKEIKRLNKKPEQARKYCAQVYLLLTKYANDQIGDTGITEFLMAKADSDFESLKAMLLQLLNRWEMTCSEKKMESYSSTVRSVIQYVHDHLGDEDLSLAAVAGRVLFLHPDYLGKLFKKETGIGFTRYVMELRIERAKKLIAENPDIRVYELSEAAGFGDNSHYFGQVFRAACGCTPSEYKKAMAAGNTADAASSSGN
ncbi:MAG: response regulator [Lachnospiraceae bacterium]|nr:response regulator [Lachnospiraceae bacterium]